MDNIKKRCEVQKWYNKFCITINCFINGEFYTCYTNETNLSYDKASKIANKGNELFKQNNIFYDGNN